MSNEIGSYDPAFFKMKVDVDGDIDLNSMSPLGFSVFFHEYIHFIQDFTTAACCRRIYVYGEYIRQCVSMIVNGSKQFLVPVDIHDKVNNVNPNIKVLSFVDGDLDSVQNVVIEQIDIVTNEIEDKDDRVFSLQTVVITTTDDNMMSFGTLAIKESMAYLIEQLCTTQHHSSPDFPYNIARLISDYVLGNKTLQDMELLALCDVSLMVSNPGLFFYKILNKIKNGDLIITKPEDIYDFYYGSNSISYATNTVIPTINDYLINAFSALDAVRKYYALNKLQDLNQWLEKVFCLGVALRTQRRYFMLEMARGNKDKQNGVLQFFAKEIGSPLIENKQGKIFKLNTKDGVAPTEYLYILEQIHDLFKQGKMACAMKNWCLQISGQPSAPADDRCDNAPWSRSTDENLCPYALFWYHRKLSGFEPVVNL